jgi:hypothetical protein
MSWGAVELEAEVEKWLEGLPTPLFARAAFYIDLLAEQGLLLGEPYTKQLDGKLRELRFYLERRALARCIEEAHSAEGKQVRRWGSELVGLRCASGG